MSINLTVPETQNHLKPRITVIGVGGAGGNAVNNMISSQLEGVEFVVANTDAQALAQNLAERSIQLGPGITHGLGAGSRPDIGRAAAEEAMDDLMEALTAAHMVFITAGMGGGTGTGAAPVIARLARENGILTVGVVTKPFQFEGVNRMRIADAGIEEMQQYVDTLIVIPNQNLFRIANEQTTFADAFTMADEVLHSGVRGVTDLMVVPGLINLDFADIRAVMSEMGKAMMGTGEGEGEERARIAAESAISNPLLDDVSMKGARGVLINITGGSDMTLFEVDEAANRIGEEVDPDANIIFGSTMDSTLEDKMRVSVVATGIDAVTEAQPRPVLKVYSQPQKLVRNKNAAFSEHTGASQGLQMGDVPKVEPNQPSEPSNDISKTTDTEEVSHPGHSEDIPPAETSVISDPENTHITDSNSTAAQRKTTGESEPGRSEPRLVSKNEAFIPPAPVDPKKPDDAKPGSDPFKEADLLNGGPGDSQPRRGGNLFRRITGSNKGSPPASSSPAQPEEPREKQEQETKKSTVIPEQTSLVGVAPEDKIENSQSEEDLLEIPAFLRRQAN